VSPQFQPTQVVTLVVTGVPGSCHDAKAFRQAPMWDEWLADTDSKSVLLGDAAYGIFHFLLVPFGGDLTVEQSRFDFYHSSARLTIERAFGKFKGQWQMFNTTQPVWFSEDISLFVHACATLHNITIDIDGGGQASEADLAFPMDPLEDLGAADAAEVQSPSVSEALSKERGRELRRNIAAALPATGRPARKSDQYLS